MTRPYNWKPGEREKVAERMARLNADPIIARKRRVAASQRMRRIHALAFEAECLGITEREANNAR